MITIPKSMGKTFTAYNGSRFTIFVDDDELTCFIEDNCPCFTVRGRVEQSGLFEVVLKETEDSHIRSYLTSLVEDPVFKEEMGYIDDIEFDVDSLHINSSYSYETGQLVSIQCQVYGFSCCLKNRIIEPLLHESDFNLCEDLTTVLVSDYPQLNELYTIKNDYRVIIDGINGTE
jgi:hypothetical protein